MQEGQNVGSTLERADWTVRFREAFRNERCYEEWFGNRGDGNRNEVRLRHRMS